MNRRYRERLSPQDALAGPISNQDSDAWLGDDNIRYQRLRHELPTSLSVPSLASSEKPPLIPYLGEKANSDTTLLQQQVRRKPVPSSQPSLSSSVKPGSKNTARLNRKAKTSNWIHLPNFILERVLSHLKFSHLQRGSYSCTTCFMRDLVAVQLTSKKWLSAAQKKLYTHIDIVGSDSSSKCRKFKSPFGARLFLLRRTLRSSNLIAALVTSLRVPDPIIPIYLEPDGHPNPEYDDYLCLVASVVMSCPNLETLTGFYSFYNHSFDRLTYALSTRRNLKQHVWIIAENDEINQRSQKQLAPGLLDDIQLYQFSLYHDRWSRLETLMLCSPGSLGVLEHGLLVYVLNSLPSLKHLCISSLDADDFHDTTLLSIPHLKSLRLEECAGITDSGLSRWSAKSNASSVEKLSLIHQSIISLFTISKIFARLTLLREFRILQTDVVPGLPHGSLIVQPLFSSQSLQFLHWDIGCHEPQMEDESIDSISHGTNVRNSSFLTRSTPNTHLAKSIIQNGFPSLTHLRAPRDLSPPGILQSTCRPATNGSVLLPSDQVCLHDYKPASTSNSLQSARIRAQNVIDQALRNQQEFMRIVVTDHSQRRIREHQQKRDVLQPDSPASWPTLSPVSSLSSPTSEYSDSGPVFSPVDVHPGFGSEDWNKEVIVQSQYLRPTDDHGPNTHQYQYRTPASDSDISRYRADSCPTIENETQRPALRPIQPLTTHNFYSSPSTFPLEPPPRSPLRVRKTSQPLKVREYTLPSFIGRVSTSSSFSSSSNPTTKTTHAPYFHLLPDLPGRDGNGGLVGWGELLQISARKSHTSKSQNSSKGCTGMWNSVVDSDDEFGEDEDNEDREGRVIDLPLGLSLTKSQESGVGVKIGKKRNSALGRRERSPSRWSHVERPAGADALQVSVEDFF